MWTQFFNCYCMVQVNAYVNGRIYFFVVENVSLFQFNMSIFMIKSYYAMPVCLSVGRFDWMNDNFYRHIYFSLHPNQKYI